MIRTSACSAVPAARLGALGLAAILVLGGCSGSSGDPNAEAAELSPLTSERAEPTENATSSATPSPTATYKPATAEGAAENVPLPVMPELAKEESAEGLRAFGEYWFSLVNYGFETGDSAPVMEISAQDCERCNIFYADLEEGYVNDDWIHGGKININSAGTQFVKTPQGRYQLLLSIRQEAVANRGPNGKVFFEHQIDKTTTAQIMEATYVSDHWVVNLVENM
ncbi:DUF6318 family protein [Arthrobacter sunyaminii]|uniref:DUF6318 domain-containing protein n=1 Tax=Arthrobacter sunyaminii TaxID=2816859 RepID=A0A975PES4_9MICC|nr:DUF6318 family protein [Arthrobacter sunyaminii]MBO0907663.1 hypothetical protein [Arthrobacter sunyaminii]QWQ35222.1 hypothetical protein KG104_12015 [Arthrobacter sunyaminii]